jgi:hypothetical protein
MRLRIAWCIVALAASSGLTELEAQRAALPKFEDYPVTDIFKGTPAQPNLSTRDARRFRTQLRRQAPSGPDFAGHFKLARWGCGAGCMYIAIIDSVTGDAYFPGISFQDGLGRTETCHHASGFSLESELFIFQGEPLQGNTTGKPGLYFYRWHDGKFSLLHYEPRCPALDRDFNVGQ